MQDYLCNEGSVRKIPGRLGGHLCGVCRGPVDHTIYPPSPGQSHLCVMLSEGQAVTRARPRA